MTSFAQGKYALMVSDRSGLVFPYKEMVREWTGAWVHSSEFEPKQPQLQPKPTSADADDDFGFTTTIQNYNDGKKYNTTTDSDE